MVVAVLFELLSGSQADHQDPDPYCFPFLNRPTCTESASETDCKTLLSILCCRLNCVSCIFVQPVG